jgi:hypothetical protein
VSWLLVLCEGFEIERSLYIGVREGKKKKKTTKWENGLVFFIFSSFFDGLTKLMESSLGQKWGFFHVLS